MQTETVALSTVIHTPFGDSLYASEAYAIGIAQDIADTTQTPCGVWKRDGWYTVCDLAPELIEPDPALDGWVLWAVIDPWAAR